MSDSALTLLRMKYWVLGLMERLRRSAAQDRQLFDLEFNLRLQAAFVIGASCEDSPAAGLRAESEARAQASGRAVSVSKDLTC